MGQPRSSVALLAVAALMAMPSVAQTQAQFPVKPVRFVVPAAGNMADVVARMIGPKLSDSWRQPVVVENRAGAGGTLAAATVAKAAPDGHSLLLISGQLAIGAVLQSNLPYQPLRDLAGVSQIGYATVVLVAMPSPNVRSVQDLVALAQDKPGKILFSSGGAGTNNHLLAELFRINAGIKAVHVGFKSTSEALVEVLAGRVQYCMANMPAALPMIRDARLQALAVTTPKRSPLLPQVPALAEVVPGFKRDAPFGLYAPARTPKPVLHLISKEVARALEHQDIKERLQSLGFSPASGTPEELDKVQSEQIEIFSALAKDIGLRAYP